MGITNIERMVEALVRDEMNYVRTMSIDEMKVFVEALVRDKFEHMTNAEITTWYEMLGD